MQHIIDDFKIAFPDMYNTYRPLHDTELYIDISAAQIKPFCHYILQKYNAALVSMFANDERSINGSYAIYYAFALRKQKMLVILKTLLSPEQASFPSITPEIHAAHLYEREIRDLFGLEPGGHPDKRSMIFHDRQNPHFHPLRKDPAVKTFHLSNSADQLSSEDFIRVRGEGVYEIPVGPVHAGIIEPGHFRFSVAGEPIINLEARLYFVHKGIEKIAEKMSITRALFLAERISGDESFANSFAYCLAVERAAGIKAPERAAYTRVVFAELERLTSHLGDLAGICIDVAYSFAAYQFRMMRGWCYLLAEELAHNRFLRNINKPGGIRDDFLKDKKSCILEYLTKIKKELAETVRIIKTNPLFIDRIENTGILSSTAAKDFNAVGPPGRASGQTFDLRKNLPYSNYDQLEFKIPRHRNGDVNCRMNVKIEECFSSIELILQVMEIMPAGQHFAEIGLIEPFTYAMGYCESPRGENMHWLMIGESNEIFRYKIRTPSFCNWPALCVAVKGNIVPDFPLINKSFNLSYAGNDL